MEGYCFGVIKRRCLYLAGLLFGKNKLKRKEISCMTHKPLFRVNIKGIVIIRIIPGRNGRGLGVGRSLCWRSTGERRQAGLSL